MEAEEIPVWEPLIKRSILFADLPEEVLHEVARRMRILPKPKGTVLFRPGDPPDTFFLIASGQVKMFSHRRGEEVLEALLGRGDSLGEMALLTGEPRSYTVRLETSCEFLTLTKKDFEEVLSEHPSVLLHISRLLSKRLFLAAQDRPDAARMAPQLLCLLPALAAEDRVLLASYFAIALQEQTRRKVLVVELSEDAGALARALGMAPTVLGEEDLRGRDLHDPDVLRGLSSEHPSGLSVISVRPEALRGRLLRAIFLLLNLLRETYDFVIAVMPDEIGTAEETILSESDKWILAGRAGEPARFDKMETALRTRVTGLKAYTRLVLDDGAEAAGRLGYDHAAVRVPWPAEFGSGYRKGGKLFSEPPRATPTHDAIERFARRIGLLKVGLAMGSGAALGYSLIGVLKVLARHRIPVDMVAGSSMGSIVGGLFALGMSPQDIEREALKIDKAWIYENVFWDLGVPRSGFLGGTTLHRFLQGYFGDIEFSGLDIPFQAIATDIQTGAEVVLKEGKVVDAVRASCGIPILVQPFFHQGRFLVDGGVVNPVPTSVVSRMGADIVIAVNLTKSPEERRVARMSKQRELLAKLTPLEGPNLWDILFRTLFTMQYEIARSQNDLPHVLIQPDNKHFRWTELHRAQELIENGEAAAEEAVAKIRTLLPFFSNFCKMPIRYSGWRGT